MAVLVRKTLFALGLLGAVVSAPAVAQTQDPFEHGWILDPQASELHFMSVKKTTVAESSSFATLSGLISEKGQARVSVLLDSVDTKVDLRNVRMRFLFFETFNFPEATISASLNPAELTDLHAMRRKFIDLTYTLSLHGIEAERTARVAVTLINNDRIAVTSTVPEAIPTKDFDLELGRSKLQDAANVDILPFGLVSFDFVFDRAQPGTPPKLAETPAQPATAALETAGNFDREACLGRFEILSQTGNIYFRSGSARLDDKSLPLLENLYDIVERCPEMQIEIAGHTDSDGSDAANQRLSEARATSVLQFLQSRGIAPGRMYAVGFGETQPAFPNDSKENKARNRRIVFSVVSE